MKIFSIVLILFSWSCVYAENTDQPHGLNCQLSSPPKTSGESPVHGFPLYVYPRAKDIDSKYSGCQSVWAKDNNNWVLISLVYIKEGEPVKYWSKEDSKTIVCSYNKGKLSKEADKTCPSAKFLIQKSLAPGCTDKLKEAATKFGVDAKPPAECKFE